MSLPVAMLELNCRSSVHPYLYVQILLTNWTANTWLEHGEGSTSRRLFWIPDYYSQSGTRAYTSHDCDKPAVFPGKYRLTPAAEFWTPPGFQQSTMPSHCYVHGTAKQFTLHADYNYDLYRYIAIRAPAVPWSALYELAGLRYNSPRTTRTKKR